VSCRGPAGVGAMLTSIKSKSGKKGPQWHELALSTSSAWGIASGSSHNSRNLGARKNFVKADIRKLGDLREQRLYTAGLPWRLREATFVPWPEVESE
jgi:hypothetical protein